MNIGIYFEPVDLEALDFFNGYELPQRIINQLWYTNKDEEVSLDDVKLAILGVPEDRYVFKNEGTGFAPNEIRKEFYKLFHWKKQTKIIDLGNLKIGKTVEDTYEILSDVLAYLIENKVEPDGKWTSVRLDFYLIAIQNDSIFITRPLLRNVYSMRTLFHVPL